MPEFEAEWIGVERRSTGVPGLDRILDGGLIAGSVYLVRGSPGAGKTILANQICFHRAGLGEHTVYITLLAEAHDRLLTHLRGMSFYRPDLVPQAVFYEGGFRTLEREGLEGVLRLLTTERKARQASFIVLDGLSVVEESVAAKLEFRKFLNAVTELAHITDTNILLLASTSGGSVEDTMVDGGIELGIEQMEYRTSRFLQVRKLRGSAFLSGRHALSISDDGIRTLPRLEVNVGHELNATLERRHLPTGVPNLDRMLSGGLRSGSTTLLTGPSGIGKTTFGAHFLSQCSPEQPGLLFGFYENEADMVDKAMALGLDLESLLRTGAVEILWHPPTEHLLDDLGYELIAAVRRRRCARLVVDSVDAFRQSAIHSARLSRFFSALSNVLHGEGVTVLYTLEYPAVIGGQPDFRFEALSAIAQNILMLRYLERDAMTRRSLSIVKTRHTRFDPAIREFFITERGVQLGAALHDDPGRSGASISSPESGEAPE